MENALEEHHKLFLSVYGKWEVTVNYHMVLHVPDTLRDFGPASGYWCFPFERFNGVLEKMPNSGKTVEQEFLKCFEFTVLGEAAKIPDISSILPQYKTPSNLSILRNESYPNDTALKNNKAKDLADSFYLLSKSAILFEMIEKQEFDFCSKWPWSEVTMLRPKKENIKLTLLFRDQLLQYFRLIYHNVQLVHARIHKYGRCFVNGITFNSDFNISDRGNVAKSYFPSDDDPSELSLLYGVIRYFFQSKVFYETSTGQVESKVHELAYIDWLQFTPGTSALEEKTGLLTVKKEIY